MTLRDRKKAKRKEEIIRSTIEMISEKGIHNTTLDDIAANLLMTTGSIYYYFKDKQELLFESQLMVVKQALYNINVIYAEEMPILPKFHKAIIMHVEFVVNERAIFETLVKPEQFLSEPQLEVYFGINEQYSDVFSKLIQESAEELMIKDFNLKIIKNLLLGAMNSTLNWYSETGNKSSEQFARIVADYLMRFLRNCSNQNFVSDSKEEK